MMFWPLIIIILGCFGFVIFFGAPYLPTLKKQRKDAIEMLDLKSGQTLLELGCGDGRLLHEAAQKGIKGIGYELNPLLAVFAWLLNFKYRHLVQIKCKNYWQSDWPKCNAIYVFLLPKYMEKLDKKIKQQKIINCVLLSYAFKIPGKRIIKHKDALFLYEY